MISRDPSFSFKGYLQDFDYGLNWQRLLDKLGLSHEEEEDWYAFVDNECAKLAPQRKAEQLAKLQKARAERRARNAVNGNAQDGREAAGSDPKHPAGNGDSQAQTSGSPVNVEQSLGTEDDTQDKLEKVEGLIGVQVPVVSPQNGQPLTDEEFKRQCKQRTVGNSPSRDSYSC